MLSLLWQLQLLCGFEFGPSRSPEFLVHFPSSRCVKKKLGLRANVGSTEWVCLRRTEGAEISPQPCLKNSHLREQGCNTGSTKVHCSGFGVPRCKATLQKAETCRTNTGWNPPGL